MIRACEPELLDSLPHGHPDAVRSRRDLRIINSVMGNRAWLADALGRVLLPGERVLEIGSGTGELAAALSRRGAAADGLDLCPPPPGWPRGRSWHQGDLRTFGGYGAYGAVVGCLIFHHLGDDELAGLGSALRRSARVIAACEPARRRSSQVLMGALGPLFGAGHVTRHDARVSIGAGFRGRELAQRLGLAPGEWNLTLGETVLGAYRMLAVRKP